MRLKKRFTSYLNSQSLYYILNISWIKLIIIFSILVRSILIKANNPIMIVIIIILQTVTVCLILWLKISSSWFSYILFLIFMGGLIVLFIYICRLASNEIFSIKIRLIEILTIFIITIVIVYYNKRIIYESNINYSIYIFNILTKMNIFPVILTIFYLLFTLVVVVKISNKKIGPIRAKKI